MANSKLGAVGSRYPGVSVFPEPVIATTAPTNADRAFEVGTMWIDQSTTAVYVLTSLTAVPGGLPTANWSNLAAGPSSPIANLTVTNAFTVTNGPTTINSTVGAGQSIYLHENVGGGAGGIDIHADQGTSATSVRLRSDGGGIQLAGGLGSIANIHLKADVPAAAGINVDCGTSGFDLDSTGSVSLTSTLDGATAIQLITNGGTNERITLSNLQGTDANSVDINSTAGGIDLRSGLVGANSMTYNSAGGMDVTVAGGFDYDLVSGTGDINLGNTAASTGAINIGDLNSGAISHMSGTDISFLTLGQIAATSTLNTAEAIYLHADAGTLESIHIHSEQGTSESAIDIEAQVGGLLLRSGAAAGNSMQLTSAGGMILTANGNSLDIVTGTNAINIGTDAAAKTITIGNATGASSVVVNVGTGAASFGANATAHTTTVGSTTGASDTVVQAGTGGLTVSCLNSAMNITTGTGDLNVGADATVHDVVVGSVTGASDTNIRAGTGGLSLTAAGLVDVVPDTDSGAGARTINANVGVATFTGLTTASGASDVVTINNSLITATSAILITAGTTTADAYLTVDGYIPAAGSMTIQLTNNGGSAVNNDVIVTFWVLAP